MLDNLSNLVSFVLTQNKDVFSLSISLFECLNQYPPALYIHDTEVTFEEVRKGLAHPFRKCAKV